MRLPLVLPAAALALAAAMSGATAQQTDACAAFKWSVARERQAFAGPALPTIKSGDQYPGMLAGVTVALGPQGAVAYPKPPARAPKSAPAYGAVLTLPPVAAAGNYQVTLSEDAWVDLVQDGAKLRSTGFSGKTGCLNVRKSVKFSLQPGPVTLEISDSAKPELKLDILPVE